MDVLILILGTRSGCVLSTTPRPLYPRERPGTHCTGGLVGPGPVWTCAIKPHKPNKYTVWAERRNLLSLSLAVHCHLRLSFLFSYTCKSSPSLLSRLPQPVVWKPEGNRPQGKTRRRWKGNINMHLQEVGCVGMGCLRIEAGTGHL
jgi:hypothetical protein